MDTEEENGRGGERQKIKIALLGNEGVGKTSIIGQLTENKYNAKTNTTVGAMFINKEMVIDGVKYDLQIWDTAGQERFRTIASIYFRDAHGILLVYDVTNKKSFDDLSFWFNEIYTKCEKSVVVEVAGNKSDMTNLEVSPETGQEFAQSHKSRHFSISAKNNVNIADSFEALLRDIIKSEIRTELGKKYKESVAVKKKNPKDKKTDGCKC